MKKILDSDYLAIVTIAIFIGLGLLSFTGVLKSTQFAQGFLFILLAVNSVLLQLYHKLVSSSQELNHKILENSRHVIDRNQELLKKLAKKDK